ncbi:amino acid transporter [Xanthomonas oryzae pv. oryzicola]|nr:amino acid transporter [Xanthomonas oryzae pv. oryzicola]AKK64008.1 amino acid transporter [Xanthomonas oryzae pv. oryzicola]QEO97589.1 amino acid transporter [Xanthomonas oryzae pv. oryzicola]
MADIQQRNMAGVRAADTTTALTARRAWPVLGIGMDHASTAAVSVPSAPI